MSLLTAYGLLGCYLLMLTTRGSHQGEVLLARQLRSLLISVGVSSCVFLVSRTVLLRLVRLGGLLTYLSLWGLFLFGAKLNGCYGWYKLGTFCIQPAEIIKPFFVLTLAWLCHELSATTRKAWKLPCLTVFIMLLLMPIILQPDLGTALILAMTFALVLWCDGLPLRHMAIVTATGLAVACTAYATYPHFQRRLDTYVHNVVHPSATKGYHARRFQECLIKGGWTGNLFCKQDALHPLPYRYSDSLFAGTVELLGVAGALPILLLCLIWFIYAYRLARHTDDRLLKLTYLGTGCIITVQALLHITVNVGLFPNTGIPLPLLSYGGSSLLATFMMVSLAQRLRLEAVHREERLPG